MTILPTGEKTKPKRCPVCNKQTLFVDLFNRQTMVCKTCKYKHEDKEY